MEFVVLILALGLATGVAGLRLSFGAPWPHSRGATSA